MKTYNLIYNLKNKNRNEKINFSSFFSIPSQIQFSSNLVFVIVFKTFVEQTLFRKHFHFCILKEAFLYLKGYYMFLVNFKIVAKGFLIKIGKTRSANII